MHWRARCSIALLWRTARHRASPLQGGSFERGAARVRSHVALPSAAGAWESASSSEQRAASSSRGGRRADSAVKCRFIRGTRVGERPAANTGHAAAPSHCSTCAEGVRKHPTTELLALLSGTARDSLPTMEFAGPRSRKRAIQRALPASHPALEHAFWPRSLCSSSPAYRDH